MLTSKQRAFLRGLGQSCPAIMQIGKSGITENLIKTVSDALEARELVKLTVLGGNALLSVWQNEFVFLFFSHLADFFILFHLLNISYCVFNLIPLPPLDGSRIFYVFLPTKWYFKVMKYERQIMIVLMIALIAGTFTGILTTAMTFLSNAIFALLSFIP